MESRPNENGWGGNWGVGYSFFFLMASFSLVRMGMLGLFFGGVLGVGQGSFFWVGRRGELCSFFLVGGVG